MQTPKPPRRQKDELNKLVSDALNKCLDIGGSGLIKKATKSAVGLLSFNVREESTKRVRIKRFSKRQELERKIKILDEEEEAEVLKTVCDEMLERLFSFYIECYQLSRISKSMESMETATLVLALWNVVGKEVLVPLNPASLDAVFAQWGNGQNFGVQKMIEELNQRQGIILSGSADKCMVSSVLSCMR